MWNLPVHWAEGLFLRPQHFQAADRHWAELFHISRQWDHEYQYGVRRIEISPEAVANYQFQVNVCHARLKDGTLVAIDAGQALNRVDLKEAFSRESVVRVYLAVPKLKMGVENVSVGGPSDKSRDLEVRQSVQDESRGGNDQEIQFRELNVRLVLSTQDHAGYEVLPLAQIRRAGESEAAPQIDDSYFPPMLAVDAWQPLGRDIVRAIYDIIGRKIEVLSEQIINRSISLASQEPGDLDRLFMLSELNAASSVLGVLAFAMGVHPLTAYVELCRIVGQLSIFSSERRPPEIPQYDHDDLARIFLYIKEKIVALLERIRDYEYEQRFFVGEGKGMRVSFESKWLASDWKWFIGVLRGDFSEKECMALLSRGALDWKLGSSRQVDALFRYGAEGLHLTPLAQTPRALPPKRDWLYFEVSRDNNAWKDVLESQTLALRFKETLIANINDLAGERKIVVKAGPKLVPLQFALFAVPNPSGSS